jgi:branched-chain amino acid transport system substrate-binding protein
MIITRRSFGAGTAALALVGPARAADGDTLRFGYTGPLSGGAALYGKNCLTGLQMAAKELNDAGGLDVGGKRMKVEVVSLDDRYSPPEAAVNAKRLVQQSGAPAVFCPHSGGVLAIEAFNQDEGFLLAAYTSSPAVTERGDKLVLRIPPSFAVYVDPFVTYEMKRFGKKLGMAGGDHEYAKAWAALFGPAWTKAGGTIVADNPMSYNKDADFYSGISKVLAAGPDVLFVGGASEPTGLVIRQAREQGFGGGFAIMDQAKMDEIAKVTDGYDMLDGAIGVLPLANDDRPAAQDFVKRYRAMFNAEAGTEAVLNFTGLNVVAKAMQLANSATDAKAARAQAEAAVKALTPKQNPVNITGIDANGGFQEMAPICAVEKGKVVALDAAKLRG